RRSYGGASWALFPPGRWGVGGASRGATRWVFTPRSASPSERFNDCPKAGHSLDGRSSRPAWELEGRWPGGGGRGNRPNRPRMTLALAFLLLLLSVPAAGGRLGALSEVELRS